MTTPRTNHKKGRMFETNCCAWINNNVPGAYCTVRAKDGGNHDQGDLRVQVGGTEGTVQCKNWSDSRRNRMGLFSPSVYRDVYESVFKQLENSGADWAALIMKAKGKGAYNPGHESFREHEVHLPRPDGTWEVITLAEWGERLGRMR